MDILERCLEACRKKPGTVVFPDSLDPRVFKAAQMLHDEGVASVMLMGSPFELRDKARASEFSRAGFAFTDPSTPELLRKNTETFVALRKERGKPIAEDEAMRLMNCPLAAAAMMVRRGEVEVGVAGNLSPTSAVLRTGLSLIPRSKGIETVSSFFIMISPDGDKAYVFADCAVVPQPDADTLADIAIASAEKARNLLRQEPRVAMLSFSTKGSANHPRAEMVRIAAEKVRKRAPDIMIDGELQVDAAMVPKVAALKAPSSVIGGQANVFVFPSLEAGNIGYKLVQRMAGYTAMGPFLQGFAGGWHDLSRGCSAKDMFLVAVIGICLQRGNLLN